MTLVDFTSLLPTETTAMKVVPVLDWLSLLMLDASMRVPEATGKDDVVAITDALVLRYYGKGSEHYKYIWHVLYNGEHYATILSHTRNEKFVKKGMVKVDIKNHLLYTTELWPFIDLLCKELGLQYKNVSRVDIAIDGLNYLVKLVNQYTKQTADEKVVELKGRGRFKANLLDRPTMMYNSFQLGAPAGKKCITIYNKSQEIVTSRKEYIQHWWKAQGIIDEVQPLEMLANALKADKGDQERYYIPGYHNVYRFELRLKGELFLQMQGFTLDWLKTGTGLMSIVRRMMEKFFEFVINTRSDNSKCESIDIIPMQAFDCFNIQMVRAKRRDDLYKTKLSIAKNVRQLYLGHLQPSDYAALQMLLFDVNNYNLQQWFNKKLFQWNKEFGPTQPDEEYRNQVVEFLAEVNQTLLSNDEETILNKYTP